LPLWVRVAALSAIAVWSIYAGIRLENRVLRRLVAAAHGSVRRALLVVTGYYVTLVAALCVFGVVAAIAYDAGWPVMTIVVLLIGLAVTAPFLLILAPAGQYGGPATSFADIRRLGASKGVARAIAYPAVAYTFVVSFPAIIGPALAVCFVE
jgi:hypothetical protein